MNDNNYLEQEIIRKAIKINSIVRLPKYEIVIEKIVRNICKNKCQIDIDFKAEVSKHCENLNYCIIYIKGDFEGSDSKELIWDMLHEFGHHQDVIPIPKGKENDDRLMLEREKRAWENADTEFKLYPELSKDVNGYEFYKKSCLRSYRINPNKHTSERDGMQSK